MISIRDCSGICKRSDSSNPPPSRPRQFRRLWKVTTFRGYLVLREVVFPNNITDTPESVDFKVDAATNKLVNQFVDNLMTSWEDVDTTDSLEDQITAWLESGESIERPEGERAEVTTGQAGDDLKESIAKAIEASK